MDLDQADLRILGELQTAARMTIAELAKRVALTATPCARRVQQLEDAGLITAYVALLDQVRLGLARRRLRRGAALARRQSRGCGIRVANAWVSRGHAVLGDVRRIRLSAARRGADLDGYNRFLRNELLSLGCVDHVQTGFALQRVVDRTALPLRHLDRRGRTAQRVRRTASRWAAPGLRN